MVAESSALLRDRDHVTTQDVEMVLRVAYDGILPRRRRVLRALLEEKTGVREIARHIGVSVNTTTRELEMLQQIKVVIRDDSERKYSKWRLRDRIAEVIGDSGLTMRILKTDLSWLEDENDDN